MRITIRGSGPANALRLVRAFFLLGALMMLVGGVSFYREGRLVRRLTLQNARATGIVLDVTYERDKRGHRTDACSICVRIDEGAARTARTCVDARVGCSTELSGRIDLLYDPGDPSVVREAQLAWTRSDSAWAMPGLAFGLGTLLLGGFLATWILGPRSASGARVRWRLATGEVLTARVDPRSGVETVYVDGRIASRANGGARRSGHEVSVQDGARGAYRGQKQVRVFFEAGACRLEVDGVEVTPEPASPDADGGG